MDINQLVKDSLCTFGKPCIFTMETKKEFTLQWLKLYQVLENLLFLKIININILTYVIFFF